MSDPRPGFITWNGMTAYYSAHELPLMTELRHLPEELKILHELKATFDARLSRE
jgi:hypothetical protein